MRYFVNLEKIVKSVSTPVKILKQRTNEGLNRAKKTFIISDSMLKRVSGAKLSRDVKTKNG